MFAESAIRLFIVRPINFIRVVAGQVSTMKLKVQLYVKQIAMAGGQRLLVQNAAVILAMFLLAKNLLQKTPGIV